MKCFTNRDIGVTRKTSTVYNRDVFVLPFLLARKVTGIINNSPPQFDYLALLRLLHTANRNFVFP